jgi:hypothetical protein
MSDRPIETILEELAAKVPREDWDKLAVANADALMEAFGFQMRPPEESAG